MLRKSIIIFSLVILLLSASVAGQTTSDKPVPVSLSYVLVVDNSGSLRPIQKQVFGAAKLIVSKNNPEDETALVRFVDSDKIETIQSFTKDQALLMKAIDSFYIEGGITAITDAVYLSVKYVAEKYKEDSQIHRRTVVLITDGDDRNSYYKREQLFQLLREKKVKVFVLGFPTQFKIGKGTKPDVRAVNYLNQIAQESGGTTFLANSKDELMANATNILDVIRSQ